MPRYMNYQEFEQQAKELALGAGLQYQKVPEGHIYLTSKTKQWVALKSPATGEIEKIIDPESDKEWPPELWLEVYRAKLRRLKQG